MNARYKNPDNDPRGPWTAGDSLRKEFREYAFYEITTPSGRKVIPPPGSSWRFNKEDLPRLIFENRLWFGGNGKGVPRIKRFLTDVKDGVIPQSIWRHDQVGNTQEAKKEVIALNAGEIFDTPKPERLIQRVLSLATSPDDLVLDSYLGSGTTAAVAHKMNRRYIGIEMGEHAVTHCLPRLKKVVEGEQGGISEAVGWKGGGGFRFMKLGEPVFQEDGCINPAVRFATLASYLWFLEAGSPHSTGTFATPLLGVMGGETNEEGVTKPRSAIILLYNGILGDRRPQAGNVLTTPIWNGILAQLPIHKGPRIIYGEACRLSREKLKALNVTFKQIPHDIRMR